MTQMAIAATASDFGPGHAMGLIHNLADIGLLEFVKEGRPPAPTVKLGVGGEEGNLADEALVDAGLVKLVEDAGVGGLGATLLGDFVLNWSQSLLQFLLRWFLGGAAVHLWGCG